MAAREKPDNDYVIRFFLLYNNTSFVPGLRPGLVKIYFFFYKEHNYIISMDLNKFSAEYKTTNLLIISCPFIYFIYHTNIYPIFYL